MLNSLCSQVLESVANLESLNTECSSSLKELRRERDGKSWENSRGILKTRAGEPEITGALREGGQTVFKFMMIPEVQMGPDQKTVVQKVCSCEPTTGCFVTPRDACKHPVPGSQASGRAPGVCASNTHLRIL